MMKEYRKKLKKDTVIGLVFIAAIIVLDLVLNLALKDSPKAHNKSFALGFLTGIVLVAVYYVVKTIRALKDESKLKKMYIEEKDERNIEVTRRASQLAIKILLITFAIALLVASHLNRDIFKVLLFVVLYSTAIIGLSTSYYKKKI